MPKNFIQQTEEMMGDYSGGHSYAIQYTTDAGTWASSPGTPSKKQHPGARLKQGIKVQVFSDGTITIPLMEQGLRVSGKRRKSVLVFD